MTPEEYVVRLLEAANKKCALLRDILFISQDQSRSITEDGVENLEKLIDEKQIKIDEINKIDEGFAEDFGRLKRMLGVESLDELKSRDINGIKDLQDAIGEIMALICEISEIEKSNSLKAKKLLESLSAKVRQVNQGKQINAAYMPGPVRPPSYFIDKKK